MKELIKQVNEKHGLEVIRIEAMEVADKRFVPIHSAFTKDNMEYFVREDTLELVDLKTRLYTVK